MATSRLSIGAFRYLLLALVLICGCRSVREPEGSETTRDHDVPVRMLDTAPDFQHRLGLSLDREKTKEVKFGLFMPTGGSNPVGEAVYRGAQLAIDEANERGGFEGIPFSLVHRWDDDPWAGGSKEITRFIYRDSVLAVIGSIDGDATHLAEQITSKTWVPLVSPISADPTLTYINIPWIFRLPPDEDRQAVVIVEQGFRSHSIGKPGVVTSTDHDGRVFAEAMSKAMGAVPLAPVFEMKVAIEHVDVDQLAERAASFSTDGIVLRMPPDAVDAFLQALKAAGLNVPIFLPWIPGLPRKEIIAAYDGPVYAVQVLDHAACPEKDRFAARYRQAYSGEPSVAAILGYDATNILMEATGIGGLSRAGIRQALWDLSGYPGISGRIRWDNGGGNDRKPELVRLRVADFELCE